MPAPTKPQQTTAIVPWKERLAAAAAEAVAAEKNASGTSNKIKTQGGIMIYNGARITGNKLPAVIIKALWHNAYYAGAFDPENPSSPVCYAYSVDGKGMAPHPDAPEPQHEDCATCPLGGDLAFGTADKGKGKKCKNMRRLGLIGAHELVNIDTATPATIDVPPGSLKGWTGYVRSIAQNHGVGLMGVITEVSIENLQTGGFSVNVGLVATDDYPDGVISPDDPCMPGLFEHADNLVLDTPYPVFEEPVKPVRPQRPVIQRPVIQRPVAPVAAQPAAPVAQRLVIQRPSPSAPQRPAVAPAAPARVAQPIRLPTAPAAAPKPPARKF